MNPEKKEVIRVILEPDVAGSQKPKCWKNRLDQGPRRQILENLINPDLGSNEDRKHIMNQDPEGKRVTKNPFEDPDPGF
jgi:hypothetical protein